MESLLRKKGLTNIELSELTNLSVMTISNARRGKGITLLTARKIARALGESIDTIWPLQDTEAA